MYTECTAHTVHIIPLVGEYIHVVWEHCSTWCMHSTTMWESATIIVEWSEHAEWCAGTCIHSPEQLQCVPEHALLVISTTPPKWPEGNYYSGLRTMVFGPLFRGHFHGIPRGFWTIFRPLFWCFRGHLFCISCIFWFTFGHPKHHFCTLRTHLEECEHGAQDDVGMSEHASGMSTCIPVWISRVTVVYSVPYGMCMGLPPLLLWYSVP